MSASVRRASSRSSVEDLDGRSGSSTQVSYERGALGGETLRRKSDICPSALRVASAVRKRGSRAGHARSSAGRLRRPRGARGRAAPRAVAGDERSSTTPTRCARRRRGVKVGGHQASSASMVEHHDGAVLRAPARRPTGSRSSRTPRRSCTRSTTCSAASTATYLTDAARVRRPAELPEPRQGPRPGRLLDRLGRHRRDRDALERARPPLRRRALRRPAGRPPGRAARRRRARRGRDLGGARRPDGPAPRRGAVDRRPQPPVAGPRRPRHRGRPDRRDVRGRRLADDHGQVRPPPARAVRARRRRGAARAHRRDDATRSTSGCCAPAPRELRERLPGDGRGRRDARAARRRPRRRRVCAARPRPRRATTSATCSTPSAPPTRPRDRPSVIFAYTIKAWRLPTRGPPGQPLRAAHRRRSGSSSPPTLGADAARPVGARSTPARRRPRCAAPPPSGCSASRRRAAPRAGDARGRRARRTAARASTQQAFGRFFVDLAHAAPEVAEHVVTVSPDVASSTNLGGWINRVGDLAPRRPHRLVRRRHRHARPLARDRARPAHRARHRRGQPRRPARRARRDLVARRPAAAADRHDLRPVRQPRAGAVVVRHVRRAASRSSSARRPA